MTQDGCGSKFEFQLDLSKSMSFPAHQGNFLIKIFFPSSEEGDLTVPDILKEHQVKNRNNERIIQKSGTA